MFRQKKYHDIKSRDDQLEPGENVYVYFPVVKLGQTPKLTSFWRGPLRVERKISDVLYEINFGTNNRRHIIHADRLKRAKEQRLIDEIDNEQIPEDQLVEQSEFDNADLADTQAIDDVLATDDTDGPVSYSRYGRQRRKPVWFTDYAFSIFSRTMADPNKRKGPNIKITPRKPVDTTICPICKEGIRGQTFQQHVLLCADSRFKCKVCTKTFKKRDYLKTLTRRYHPTEKVESSVAAELTLSDSSDNSDSESDWNKDPDVELEDPRKDEKDQRKVNDLTTGRVIRRPLGPTPVFTPVKRKSTEGTEVSDTQDRENLYTENVSEGCHLKVSFGVKRSKEDKLVQSFVLDQNGAELINSKVTRSKMGDVKLNLGDFIRSAIRPEDVDICVTDGMLSLPIKYK